MQRMLKGLPIWALLGAFLAGTSAQTITKDANGDLVFPPIPQYCVYNVTEQLMQTPKSATFGNVATGVVHTIAPVGFAEYVNAISDIAENPEIFTNNPANYGTFFVGIAILFILGLILALLVPCIGCIFCCCRCCGNCGGKMVQKTEDNTLCKRWTFALILLVISLVLGVGCASVYLGGRTLVGSAETLTDTVLKTTDDLQCYISESLTSEFEFLVNTSITGVTDLAFEEIDGISNDVNNLIQDADQAIDTVKSLDEEAREINSTLSEAADLQDAEEALKTSLEDFVNAYNATLNTPACMSDSNCSTARQNFDSAPFLVNNDVALAVDVDSVLSALTDILAQNLTGQAEELRKQLDPVKEFIDENNVDSQDIEFDSNILREVTDPITQSFDETFDSIRVTLQDPIFTDVVNQSSMYGFIGVAIFAGLVGIIAVLYILGMIFGEIGHNRDDIPTERDCMAKCGGCLLVIGWVLSLLLYFIIAIFAAWFFLFGSLGEKFICQPLSDPANLATIQELLVEQIPEASNFTFIDFETALRNCEANQGIWSALNLEGQFGSELDSALATFENELNLTAILGDMNFDEALEYDTTPVKDLTNIDFSDIDFDALETELNRPFPNLTVQIENIKTLSDAVGDTTLQTMLSNHADDLENIQTLELEPLQEQVHNFSRDLPALEDKINDLKNNADQLVTDVENLLDRAQGTLENVQNLVANISDIIGDTLNNAKTEIRSNLGKCRPLYNLYDSIDFILCDNIFDSLNSIWLGFGIAVVFFIFGVIFAVKLSKFYREMSYPDESEMGHAYQPPYNEQHAEPYAKNYPV